MWRYTELTKNQKHVVDRLRDGWELGLDTDYWLQKGGCGFGGESEKVNSSTAHALYKKGVVVVKSSRFPLDTFRLNIEHEDICR